MITVKQLESELNVSRVSLYAMLKKEQFANHVVRGNKNIIMLDDVGAERLRQYYLNKIRGGEPPNQKKSDVKKDEVGTADTLSVVGALKQQLEKKDRQIESLLEIVANQQKAK